MERTDHILMVGRDALAFAKKWGFTEEDLLTEKTREAYLRRKENLSDRDDWGPPEHLKDLPESPMSWLWTGTGTWRASQPPADWASRSPAG